MTPPSTIAHYRIISKLGEGGMGAVYRATDTKLNRHVAIKVLPDAFAADPDRLARFTREARVVASLNHPSIATIYGVEDRALVMELVPGPTLAERIAQGPIPLDEALPIAKQIAEALEYAHERGIIHRDLKPANVKVTPEGRVKVLDFGLAKALTNEIVSGDPASSATLTMPATIAGVIMGTAGYMSPEQAKGKPVDRRTDIWAFGVVFAEMLTGRRMYSGETLPETLAAVIMNEPDVALPPTTPVAVRNLVRRCLDRDPQFRLRDIGEARILLDGRYGVAADTTSAAVPIMAPRRGFLPWAAGMLALIAAILAALVWRATMTVDRPMMRLSVELDPDSVPGLHGTVAISPDGTRIVYPVRSAGGTQLATRLLDESKATILSSTQGATDPFFSPDRQWVGFFSDGKMRKISVQSGAAVTLFEVPASGPRGASWYGDSIIATLDFRHLFRVPAAGGKPEMLAQKPEAKGYIAYRWPQILPGGDTVLLTATSTSASFEDATIAALSLKTGDLKVLERGGYFGRYLPSGHLVYVHQGTLFAVAFEDKLLETRGIPAPVIENIAGNTTSGAADFDFSRTGTLVYVNAKTKGDLRTLVWMDGEGKKIPLVTTSSAVLTPRVSPDGKRLAMEMNGDISVYDSQRGAMIRITFTAASNRNPVWTPDGRHIVYAPVDGGIWWTRSDGSAQAQRMLETKAPAVPGSFSPDGKRLAFHQEGKGTSQDIWVLPLDTTDLDHPKAGKPEAFVQTPASEVDPAFSPDGRWLAYTSFESGAPYVYVRPYPGSAIGSSSEVGKWQVSTTPGAFARWSTVRRELFYVTTDGHIMVVDYTATTDTFTPGKPRQWCDQPILLTGGFRPLDIAPDGNRFVVFPTAEAGSENRGSLHVVFLINFFDELKRRMKR